MATNLNVVYFDFRGKTITVGINVVEKLPKVSEFMQYIHNTYKQDFQSLVSAGSKENNAPPACIFMERNPTLFEHILDYVQDGELHFSHTVCVSLLQKELKFWGYSEADLAPCCLDRVLKEELSSKEYDKFKSKWSLTQRPQGTCKEGRNVMPEYSNEKLNRGWICSDVFLNPASCILAKIYAGFIIFVIILSLVAMSVETIPSVVHYNPYTYDVTEETLEEPGISRRIWMNIIEIICTLILVLDFFVRFVLHGSGRLRFLIRPISILDLLGIVPAVVSIIVEFMVAEYPIVAMFRMFRVCRVIYLMMAIRSIRAVMLAIRNSFIELLFLLFLYGIFSSVFGILIYYAEINSSYSQIRSAFTGQWWAVVTMTTVGYGDICPTTVFGQIVASFCAFTGILLAALAISVLVRNFLSVIKHFEKLERQRCKVVRARSV